MSEADREEAKEFAERAGTQGKHAVQNTGRAVRAVTEPVVESAGDKIEETAHDAVRVARKVNVGVLGRMSSDTGVGFLALSVAIYSSAVAYAKFRQALAGSHRITS